MKVNNIKIYGEEYVQACESTKHSIRCVVGLDVDDVVETFKSFKKKQGDKVCLKRQRQ